MSPLVGVDDSGSAAAPADRVHVKGSTHLSLGDPWRGRRPGHSLFGAALKRLLSGVVTITLLGRLLDWLLGFHAFTQGQDCVLLTGRPGGLGRMSGPQMPLWAGPPLAMIQTSPTCLAEVL